MTERFNHPALDKVYVLLDDIEKIEAIYKQAKQDLHDEIMGLPEKIGDNEDLQEEVFCALYWQDERIPALALRKAFQVKTGGRLDKALKKAYIQVTCTTCHQPFTIEVTSRSDLQIRKQSLERGFGTTCENCKQADQAKTHQQYAQWQAQREARAFELHTMPYRDYLQAPEWQERRKAAMKRSGFRCQVCNAYGKRLNVHHRTYERRGYEDNRDLIVLCEDCHGIFHENGTLAREE